MASLNPAKFLREVRQEMDRVTWPSRRETVVSTVMVLALVTIAALFFVAVDGIIGMVGRWILGI